MSPCPEPASLLRTSDGSLVDRAELLRRAARGIVTGDEWLARGRMPALIAYLSQARGARSRLTSDLPARAIGGGDALGAPPAIVCLRRGP